MPLACGEGCRRAPSMRGRYAQMYVQMYVHTYVCVFLCVYVGVYLFIDNTLGQVQAASNQYNITKSGDIVPSETGQNDITE